MERPGVHPRCFKENGRKRRPTPTYEAEKTAEVVELLRLCAESEDVEEILRRTSPVGKRLPGDEWWSWIGSPLMTYAMHMLDRLQVRSLTAGVWDHDAASRLCDASALHDVWYLANRLRDYRKGNEFILRGTDSHMYVLVLMLVEGQAERALKLANALVSASRWSAEYKPTLSHYTVAFIVRILADHLGRAPRAIDVPRLRKSAFDPGPWLEPLLASWKAPDARTLEPLLLAACDVHTHLAWSGAKFEEREFTNGFWTRIPLAAFLVFKLREFRGLPNPALEHPLLDSPLGRLPQPGYVPDDLIARLAARLARSGVSFDATLAPFEGDVLPGRA